MSSWLPILQNNAVTLWASVMLIAVFFLIARVGHASQRMALTIALLSVLTPVAVLTNIG
jgi:hypothetical protein